MRLDVFEVLDVMRDVAAAEAAHAATCPYCIEDRVNAMYADALAKAPAARRQESTKPTKAAK